MIDREIQTNSSGTSPVVSRIPRFVERPTSQTIAATPQQLTATSVGEDNNVCKSTKTWYSKCQG